MRLNQSQDLFIFLNHTCCFLKHQFFPPLTITLCIYKDAIVCFQTQGCHVLVDICLSNNTKAKCCQSSHFLLCFSLHESRFSGSWCFTTHSAAAPFWGWAWTLTAMWHFCQLGPKGAPRVNSTEQEPHRQVTQAQYGMSCRYESEVSQARAKTQISDSPCMKTQSCPAESWRRVTQRPRLCSGLSLLRLNAPTRASTWLQKPSSVDQEAPLETKLYSHNREIITCPNRDNPRLTVACYPSRSPCSACCSVLAVSNTAQLLSAWVCVIRLLQWQWILRWRCDDDCRKRAWGVRWPLNFV